MQELKNANKLKEAICKYEREEYIILYESEEK